MGPESKVFVVVPVAAVTSELLVVAIETDVVPGDSISLELTAGGTDGAVDTTNIDDVACVTASVVELPVDFDSRDREALVVVVETDLSAVDAAAVETALDEEFSIAVELFELEKLALTLALVALLAAKLREGLELKLGLAIELELRPVEALTEVAWLLVALP